MGNSDKPDRSGRHRQDLTDLPQLGEDVAATRDGTATPAQQANAQQATQTGNHAADDPTNKS